MRKLVIDTETTGLTEKDRICEIACIELIDNKRTGMVFHSYINPERESHPKALEVHGLSSGFLADKPLFVDIASALMDFLGDSTWIIHNAPFDTKFIMREFYLLGKLLKPITFCTLAFARRRHQLTSNTLNKLCELYKIDTSHRVVHGAYTDADILTQLYKRMVIDEQSKV